MSHVVTELKWPGVCQIRVLIGNYDYGKIQRMRYIIVSTLKKNLALFKQVLVNLGKARDIKELCLLQFLSFLRWPSLEVHEDQREKKLIIVHSPSSVT